MTSLNPGQSFVAERIVASRRWNHTGLLLETTKTYRFEVPDGERWTDLVIPSDANGYQCLLMRPAERKRRVRTANWFALIGALGEDDRAAFVIGTRLDQFHPAADGELVCYANDWPNMYWNNHGSIRLSIACVA